MLQLLELLEKALAPLALLAGILFALAQTAKILLTSGPNRPSPSYSETARGKCGRRRGGHSDIGCGSPFALHWATPAWVSYVLHLGPGRGWVVIGGLIPGIVATIILGVKPLDQPGKPGLADCGSMDRTSLLGGCHGGVPDLLFGPDQD